MMNPDTPPVLDIEASGFGRGSYPIEIGYVRSDGSTWCTLIRPFPQWQHWDPQAEQVHGIARPLLFEHGRVATEITERMNRELRGQTVYSDAWYHDYIWLNQLFDSADTQPAFTLKDMRSLLDEPEQARWDATRRAVAERLQLNRHRASNDARILQSTLLQIKHGTVLN
jgi:hypothetical protein